MNAEKTLECHPLGTGMLRISCQVIGGTAESAVCVYDNGSRTDDPCKSSSSLDMSHLQELLH